MLRLIVGITTMIAAGAHMLSDLLEFYNNGFSNSQLWLNYAAFVPMPYLTLGVCLCHKAKLGPWSYVGSILYGLSFVYFQHSTLYALELNIREYDVLWERLGSIYTFYGVVMIVGGLLFGFSVLKAKEVSRIGSQVFIMGLISHILLYLFSSSDSLQVVASSLRNIGLIGMGFSLLISSQIA